ncbi:MAG: hypothetical protein JNM09_26620, partial [Blastocatellia bacterium]|nr:hypothetical protein [Blastocatellia bacterium]
MMGISNFADWFATAAAPTNEVAAEPLPPEDAAQAFASLLAAAYTPTQSAPVTEMATVSEVPAQTFAPTPAASGFTLPIDFLNSRDSKSASVEITDTPKARNTVSASMAESSQIQSELPEKMAVPTNASSQSADATPLTFSAETTRPADSTEPDVLPATSSEKIAAPETKETPSPDRLSGVISKQSPDLNPAVTFRQEVKDESRATTPDAPHREPEMLRNNSVETRELEKPALPTPAISPPLTTRKVDSQQKASPVLIESPLALEPSSSPFVMQSSSDETSAKLQEQPVPGAVASIEREIIEIIELQEQPVKIVGLQEQTVESATPKNEPPSLPTASIKAPTGEINGAVQQVKSESEPQIVKGQKDVSWASVEVRALFTPVVVQGNSEAIKLAMAAVKTLVAENHPDTALPQSGALITETVSVAVASAAEVVPADALLPQGKPTITVVPQVSEVVRRILAQVNEPALPAATSTVEVDTQSEAVRTEAARTTA